MSKPETRSENQPRPDDAATSRVSRRLFLKSSSAAVAATGLAGVGAVTSGVAAQDEAATPAASLAASPVASPAASPAAALTTETPLKFFNLHQAQTVEALAARIIPGTLEDPGAREAGVVYYVDGVLAGPYGWGQQTYQQGPFLVVNEAPVAAPSEDTTRRDIYQYIEVAPEEAARYGYQSVLTPQDVYRRGLDSVDAHSMATYNKAFVELTEDEQDQVVTAMVDGSATGFDDPSSSNFFTTLRTHTIEGMFGDPTYGGNLDMVGWKMIGYPGAQRSYSQEEMLNPEGVTREPQSLADLAGLHEH